METNSSFYKFHLQVSKIIALEEKEVINFTLHIFYIFTCVIYIYVPEFIILATFKCMIQ